MQVVLPLMNRLSVQGRATLAAHGALSECSPFETVYHDGYDWIIEQRRDATDHFDWMRGTVQRLPVGLGIEAASLMFSYRTLQSAVGCPEQEVSWTVKTMMP